MLFGDALGEALNNGGLSDAGFAYQDRIVLCPAAKYFDQPFDLRIAADERIKFAIFRCNGKVACKLRKIWVFRLLFSDLT
jgi:hypothetical protein